MRIYFRPLLACKWLILLNGGSAWESNPPTSSSPVHWF